MGVPGTGGHQDEEQAWPFEEQHGAECLDSRAPGHGRGLQSERAGWRPPGPQLELPLSLR